jgi:hypothetical protein
VTAGRVDASEAVVPHDARMPGYFSDASNRCFVTVDSQVAQVAASAFETPQDTFGGPGTATRASRNLRNLARLKDGEFAVSSRKK